MGKTMLDYSIVIPTYNSPNLIQLVTELHTYFLQKGTFEIILVNDGGKPLSISTPSVRILSFKENCGKNYALFEGFKASNGEYIITLDDDGQHPITEIDKLLSLRQHDVVIGSYASENTLGSWIKHGTEQLLLQKNNIRFTPFKLIKKQCLKLNLFENRVPFTSTLILASTKDIVTIDVTISQKHNRHSRFSFSKQIVLYRNLIASKSIFWQKLVLIKRRQPIFL